jgi:hypothetical protein
VEAGLDEGARDKLAALDDLGGLLRAAYGSAGEGVDVWPAVQREIARAKVVPLRRRLGRASIVASTLAVAAAAAAALLLLPGGGHPSNDCVIDELEVSGASATILRLDDDKHGGSTTVLWLEE